MLPSGSYEGRGYF